MSRIFLKKNNTGIGWFLQETLPVPFFAPLNLLGLAIYSLHAAAPMPALTAATLSRQPFQAEFGNRGKTVNFWAYADGDRRYIPLSSLAKILGGRVHRYGRSDTAVLHLSGSKFIEAGAGKKFLFLGKKPLDLKNEILNSPDKKDLLVPLEALLSDSFISYAHWEIQIEGEDKLQLYSVYDIEPPVLAVVDGATLITIRLPSGLRGYEMTFHPSKAAIASLAIHFPFSRISGLRTSGKEWASSVDAAEHALILNFPLHPSVAFSDIEAKEENWPARRLIVWIAPPSARSEQITSRGPPPKAEVKIAGGEIAPRLQAGTLRLVPKPKLDLTVHPPAQVEISGKRPAKTGTATPLKSAPARAKTEPPVIILDPGHGGRDTGSPGLFGMLEKDVNLSMAKRIKDALSKALPEARIILSRAGDTTVELSDRARLARAKQALVFISLHANATRSSTKGGFEIYIPASISVNLKDAPSYAPAWAKALRHTQDSPSGALRHTQDSPSGALRHTHESLTGATPHKGKHGARETAHRWLMKESELLARSVHEVLENHIGSKIGSRGILKGDFLVLRESGCPAILIEAGFLTNKNDAGHLKNPKFANQFANAIAKGVARHLHRGLAALRHTQDSLAGAPAYGGPAVPPSSVSGGPSGALRHTQDSPSGALRHTQDSLSGALPNHAI